MLRSAWLFVGAVAVLASSASVTTDDDSAAMLFGAIGVVTWGVWAFGALDVQVATDSSIEAFATPAASLLGLVFALVPAYPLLFGPVELFRRPTEETDFEEL